MAAYISFEPSDFFNTTIYTGTGSSQALTGVGFQPDLGWFKARNATEWNAVFDSVRGANEAIYTNSTNAETSRSSSVMSFNADGYTLGGDGDTNAAYNYASWNWKGGTTTGLSGGTLTPSSYSFNATSGFGIYAYTGTGSAATIPHGLGVAPEVLIVKRLDSTSAWSMYWKVLGANKYIYMNATAAAATDSSSEFWNNTDPTSTVFSVKDAAYTNGSTNTYVAYCFAEKTGFSKFGQYKGNASTSGPFINTGFRPSMLIIKNAGAAEAWRQWDDKREGYNPTNDSLSPNNNWAEATGGTAQGVNLLSNGFRITSSNSEVNSNATQYIYAAWAEFPLVSSNSKAGTAR